MRRGILASHHAVGAGVSGEQGLGSGAGSGGKPCGAQALPSRGRRALPVGAELWAPEEKAGGWAPQAGSPRISEVGAGRGTPQRPPSLRGAEDSLWGGLEAPVGGRVHLLHHLQP